MADYILTTKNVNFAGFEVVNSVKGITNLTVNSILIVESYTDTNFDFTTFLVGAARSVMFEKIAYISSNPVMIVMEVMKVLKALCIPDSTLLDSQEGLSHLFTMLSDGSQSFHVDELEEVSNNLMVVDSFLSESLATKPKASQKLVSASWDSIMSTIDRVVMSDELRSELQEFLFLFTNKTSQMEQEVKRAEDELSNMRASRVSSFDDYGSYSQFTYMGNAKVLLIKEHTPTRFLTSYLIAFNDWLSRTKDARSKLLIIDRDYPAVDTRYGSLPKADVKSIQRNSGSFVLSPVIYTTTPTHAVMSELMSHDIHAYIVLDRTYKPDNIITGRGIKVVNAVSSRRVMRSMNLDSTSTILNEGGERSQLSALGFVENYPLDANSRLTTQQTAFDIGMSRLAEVLGYK